MLKFELNGIGYAVPERVVTNNDIEAEYGIPAEWIAKTTGIQQRRYAQDHESCASLASTAAQRALKASNINTADIGLIVNSSAAADHCAPPTSCLIQNNIGAYNAACIDINAACLSFVWGLYIASQLLGQETYQHILVIGVDLATRGANFNDKNTFVLLGDGASAAIISPGQQNKGILASYFRSDGTQWDAATILYGGATPGPRAINQMSAEEMEKHLFSMNGKRIFKFAVNAFQETIHVLLEKAQLQIDDIKLIIPHQANGRILESAIKKSNIEPEKFYLNIERFGNTSAATVGIALAEAFENHLITPGDKVMLIGFGSGLVWGGVIIEL